MVRWLINRTVSTSSTSCMCYRSSPVPAAAAGAAGGTLTLQPRKIHFGAADPAAMAIFTSSNKWGGALPFYLPCSALQSAAIYNRWWLSAFFLCVCVCLPLQIGHWIPCKPWTPWHILEHQKIMHRVYLPLADVSISPAALVRSYRTGIQQAIHSTAWTYKLNTSWSWSPKDCSTNEEALALACLIYISVHHIK